MQKKESILDSNMKTSIGNISEESETESDLTIESKDVRIRFKEPIG